MRQQQGYGWNDSATKLACLNKPTRRRQLGRGCAHWNLHYSALSLVFRNLICHQLFQPVISPKRAFHHDCNGSLAERQCYTEVLRSDICNGSPAPIRQRSPASSRQQRPCIEHATDYSIEGVSSPVHSRSVRALARKATCVSLDMLRAGNRLERESDNAEYSFAHPRAYDQAVEGSTRLRIKDGSDLYKGYTWRR